MHPSLRPALCILMSLLTAATVQLPLHAQSSPAPIPGVIDIDEHCRIITADPRDPTKPHHHSDNAICHIEGDKESQRWDETIVNGVKKKVFVNIHEHIFMLQNPYPQPVTFIVRQPITKNYHLDSQPQPNDITNNIATFRVSVQPGQTVGLHVGEHD